MAEYRKVRTSEDAVDAFDMRNALSPDDPRFVDIGTARGFQLATRLGRLTRGGAERPMRALLVGHRGTGKSTELRAAAATLTSTHFVRVCDFSTRLDVDDVAVEDLLLVLMEELLGLCQEHGLALSPGPLEEFRDWGVTIVATDTSSRSAEAEVGGGVDTTATPTLVGSVLGLVGKLTATFKLSKERRREVRRELEPRLGDLAETIRTISKQAMAMAAAANKSILVLADGLDLMRFREAGDAPAPYEVLLTFQTHFIDAFRCHLLLVAPVGLLVQGRPEQFWLVERMPNLPVWRRDGTLDENVQKLLMDVVAARASIHDLFKGGEGDVAFCVRMSGGNIRDLLRLVGNAAMNTYAERIDSDDLKKEARSMGAGLWARTRSGEERERLSAIKRTRLDLTDDPLIQSFLQRGILVSYNGEGWVAVHPSIQFARGWLDENGQ